MTHKRPGAPLKSTLLTLLLTCSGSGMLQAAGPSQVETLANLPVPISNNAVALRPKGDGYEIVSALGLESGKTWRDTSSKAFRYASQTGQWESIHDVPGPAGRLAASAVAVAGNVYVFGGYTVAEDGSESSVPKVYKLQQDSGEWQEYTRMPIPVEDSVLLVYGDRYVYLLSGWHDLGNVNLVQVLDTRDGSWRQATPYPGAPVFGHAGGISGNRLLVCDGVRIEYPHTGAARRFVPSFECWKGQISTDDHRRIDWQPVVAHPGMARYRMAASGDDQASVFFAGGSPNPYNFDGTGYNGLPSEPEARVFSYDFEDGGWKCHGNLPVATMDHRALLSHAGWFYIVGGMRAGQQVSDGVFRFRPAPARKCPAETLQTSGPTP